MRVVLTALILATTTDGCWLLSGLVLPCSAMLSALRSVKARAVCVSAPRRTHVNFYNTVAELTRTHWKTGAHPAPRSIVEEEDDEDWPAPQKEERVSDEPDPETDESASASTSTRPLQHRPYAMKPELKPTPQEFAAHRKTMQRKFPEGWAPPRKISREAMDSVRSLHAIDPGRFSTPILAERFHISKEAVRRILKSKWEPTRDEKVRLAAKEREARSQWKMQKRDAERQKHEATQEEYRIEPEERQEDKLTFT
ncbi:hypothetical protein C2E23DRAFT_901698 [Lenzites betulinus]|nr:hypothetical protein C2E23DRAFT_901698 [Lenzites betulinus]